MPAAGRIDNPTTGFGWESAVTLRDFIFFTISVGVAGLIGYLIADRLCPRNYPRWLVWAFAPATGLGICSLIVFFFRRPMATVEAMLLTGLLLFWFGTHGLPLAGWREIFSWRASMLAVVFAVILGWSVGASAVHVERSPHGGTDGWAIWSSHAKYIASGGKTWALDIQNTFHPDYPLLLPAALVHTWRYIGSNSPDAAGFLGILFELAGVAVLAATLIKLRSPAIGFLMTFVLIGSPAYVLHATSGYADVPLSAFVVSTIALICLYESDDSKPPGLIALAGFMAGCAAWTKNEGVPFALATAVILALPVFRTRSATLRRIAGFAAGLALPLAAIAYFKLAVAPPNDLFVNRNSADFLAKLSDSSRYLIILKSYIRTGWTFGGWVFNPFLPVLAFVGLSGVDRSVLRNFGWRACIAIITILMAGYFAIYVITPLELNDHLASSLNRLMMHVWPACLLLAGMTARRQISAKNP
jgi:hypothetical protein